MSKMTLLLIDIISTFCSVLVSKSYQFAESVTNEQLKCCPVKRVMLLLGQVGKCMEINTVSMDGLFKVFLLLVYEVILRSSEKVNVYSSY
jgi:hypothetical protein